jgi:hypothetical protein
MKSKIIRRIGALSLVILMIAAYGISMPKFALADACVMGECAQGFNCDPNSNRLEMVLQELALSLRAMVQPGPRPSL